MRILSLSFNKEYANKSFTRHTPQPLIKTEDDQWTAFVHNKLQKKKKKRKMFVTLQRSDSFWKKVIPFARVNRLLQMAITISYQFNLMQLKFLKKSIASWNESKTQRLSVFFFISLPFVCWIQNGNLTVILLPIQELAIWTMNMLHYSTKSVCLTCPSI